MICSLESGERVRFWSWDVMEEDMFVLKERLYIWVSCDR